MPPTKSTRLNPSVPTPQAIVQPTAGRPRKGRTSPLVTPVAETPSSNTPMPPPPESGLPQTTKELEQLISERLSIALATARNLDSRRPIVEVNGLRNGLESTLNSNPEEPQSTCSYKDFMNCKPKNFMEIRESSV